MLAIIIITDIFHNGTCLKNREVVLGMIDDSLGGFSVSNACQDSYTRENMNIYAHRDSSIRIYLDEPWLLLSVFRNINGFQVVWNT
jgi:hypothetical protein